MINASKNIFDKFDVVSSEIDRNAVFNELAKGNAPIAVVTDDEQTFIFHLSRFQNNLLLMAPIESPRALKVNENAFLLFSISTGQYALKGPLKLTREGIVGFMTNTELRRLQRRKDFRVHTVNTRTLTNELIFSNEKVFKLEIVDISAGGMAVIFKSKEDFEIKKGLEFLCNLSHPDRQIEGLQAIIRHIETTPEGPCLGIQFVNLTREQMSAMLALTLQMHRENTAKIDI